MPQPVKEVQQESLARLSKIDAPTDHLEQLSLAKS
jgi:hypothetical protein